MAEDDVPVELRRLWRLPADSRLGRPAVLDVERVVAAAVDLADRGGLAGVTLPTIAAAFRVTPMSLYRHVGSKTELLELMRDHAGGLAPTIGDEHGWRSGLRAWAAAQRAVFDRHPWLAQLPLSGPPSGPNAISWMEECLRTLRHTGLSWGAKLGVLTLLGGFVRSSSLVRHELAEGRRGTGLDQAQAEQAYGEALARLVDPGRFPETAAMFRSQVFEAAGSPAPGSASPGSPAPGSASLGSAATASPFPGSAATGSAATGSGAAGENDGPAVDADPDFTFGLELILDGVAAAITRSS